MRNWFVRKQESTHDREIITLESCDTCISVVDELRNNSITSLLQKMKKEANNGEFCIIVNFQIENKDTLKMLEKMGFSIRTYAGTSSKVSW